MSLRIERPADKANSDSAEAGFGMIEIVVSMFLLALLAVAFLPLLVNSMTTSVRNSSIATATQLVGKQLDELRALPSNCSAIDAFDDDPPATTTDTRGTVYELHREVGTCDSASPSTVEVRVWVAEPDTARPLSEAVTLVYVETPAEPETP